MRINSLNRDMSPEETRGSDSQDKRDWQEARRWLRDVSGRVGRFLKDHVVGMTSNAGKRNSFEAIYQQYVIPRRSFDGLTQAEPRLRSLSQEPAEPAQQPDDGKQHRRAGRRAPRPASDDSGRRQGPQRAVEAGLTPVIPRSTDNPGFRPARSAPSRTALSCGSARRFRPSAAFFRSARSWPPNRSTGRLLPCAPIRSATRRREFFSSALIRG